jgi:hypothetical protein
MYNSYDSTENSYDEMPWFEETVLSRQTSGYGSVRIQTPVVLSRQSSGSGMHCLARQLLTGDTWLTFR